MHKAIPAEMTSVMMMKMQKDAELDKKIEALRKKNEALMKRYQEVEEDKKRAEQEGMTLPSRKGKPDDLTITFNKSSNEQRVVTKKSGPRVTNPKSDQEQNSCDPGSRSTLCVGRGKRRQLLITTPGNIKGKKVFGERKDRNRPVSPARVKVSTEEEQETPSSTKTIIEIQGTEISQPPDVNDINDLTSKEDQMEYLRWKKEREEIDRERVARHKNAKGQWRRAWDVEKPDLMFSDKFHEGPDRDTQNTGNRNGKRGNLRSEESKAQEKKRKSLPVVSSKAKGKERLTGRARRWDAKEQEEHLKAYPESSLKEFLEELDALCSSEEKNINPETKNHDDVLNTTPCVSEVPLNSEKAIGDVTSDKEIADKKVCFSEELHDGGHEISNSDTTETSSLKSSSQVQSDSVHEERKTAQRQNDKDKEKIANETQTSVVMNDPSVDKNVCEKKRSGSSLITEGNKDESSKALCSTSTSVNGEDVCVLTEATVEESCSSRGTEKLNLKSDESQ
ncbi:coiled-coil domain-containing protein 9B isoform X2 [Paramisgurnus dabryanus]|uniref:coiled-coil domain-containing protein 9B isoform X2 n=1 Tax=Paramisgurnus dabryanus TaxID=90735 RepID=UPI0031F3C340